MDASVKKSKKGAGGTEKVLWKGLLYPDFSPDANPDGRDSRLLDALENLDRIAEKKGFKNPHRYVINSGDLLVEDYNLERGLRLYTSYVPGRFPFRNITKKAIYVIALYRITHKDERSKDTSLIEDDPVEDTGDSRMRFHRMSDKTPRKHGGFTPPRFKDVPIKHSISECDGFRFVAAHITPRKKRKK